MAHEAIIEMTPEEGLFELTLINAEQIVHNFEDVVIDGLKKGIPPEILTRLKDLWEFSKEVAGEIVAIGKIIVTAIFEFIKQNPLLTIGLAIGAAVAALIAGIPYFGPLLEPMSSLIATTYGAGVGAAMQKNDYSGSPFTAAIELASKFFELLNLIFNAVAGYWNS